MKHIYLFLWIVLLFIFSCNRTKRTEAKENTIDSLTLSTYRISNTIGETLIPTAKSAVSEWNEYNDVDEFILSYYNISVSEAFNKSKKLLELVKLMKDTIRVERLKKPNVIARFNVLYNEVLRLKDMATIPTISDEEVSVEVAQILAIYTAVNSKINAIYKVQEIQDALEVDTETPIIDQPKKEVLKKPKVYPKNTPKPLKKGLKTE